MTPMPSLPRRLSAGLGRLTAPLGGRLRRLSFRHTLQRRFHAAGLALVPAVTALRPAVTAVRPVAPLLDAILPGLGHLIAGRRQLALIFGLPTLALIGIGTTVLLTTSVARLVAEAINAIAFIFLLQGLILAWRLMAVGTSLASAPPRPWRAQALPVALLLGFVIGPQVYAGYVTNVAREELDRVFSATVLPGDVDPSMTFAPDALSTPGPTFAPEPSPTPYGSRNRLTVLLLGMDSGPGRYTALTDTMIVASLDPVSRTVSMISVPRDMVDVPLADGRKFHDKINALDTYVRLYPKSFPSSDPASHDVLMGALGSLLGLHIDYFAAVNLPNFVTVVDALGGVDVKVANAFCDPSYDEYGFTKGFSITAGWHHLNGQEALAYARVRRANGESDFTRAARQQEVLSGLRDGIVRGDLLSDPVGLLRALGQTIQTDVPRELLPALADLMGQIDRTRTYRTVIEYPFVVDDLDPVRGAVEIPDLAGIRKLSARLFPEPGTLPDTSFLVAAAAPVSGPDASSDASPGPESSAPPEPTGTSDIALGGAAPTDQPLTSGVNSCSYAPVRATPRPVVPSRTVAPTSTPAPTPAPVATPTPTRTATPKPTKP